jgi:hypothetical protein
MLYVVVVLIVVVVVVVVFVVVVVVVLNHHNFLQFLLKVFNLLLDLPQEKGRRPPVHGTVVVGER